MDNTPASLSRPSRIKVYLPLVLTLILGLGVVALVLLGLASARPSRAATLCVKPGGGDSCEAAIRDALAIASQGDTIQVAGGTYTENVHITQTITLQGGWAPDFSVRDLAQFTSTIVPEDETFSVLYIDGDAGDTSLVAPTVEGFEITGGRADLGGNHGGGMRIIGSDAVISSNTIRGNSAFLLGGGIWVAGGAPLIEGNRIENNISDGLGQEAYGGGIQLDGAEAVLSGNHIQENSARGNPVSFGGGVGISFGSLVFSNNAVISNTAAPGRGGGLSVQNASVHVDQAWIQGNFATARGGGILNTGVLTVANSDILGNSSNLGGGIANLMEGRLFLSDTAIEGNEAVSSGGGIYTLGSTEIGQSTFRFNSSKLGGGIYRPGAGISGTLRIEASILEENTATENGGAVAAYGLTLTGSQVSGNTALEYGGCFYLFGPVTITQSVLSGNLAQVDGGCIRVGSPSGLISNTTIANNSSGRFGGGIANTDDLTIINSTIHANEAAFGGGGIYNGFNLNLTNVTLSDNRVLHGGGLDNNYMAYLTNVTIAGNQAGFGSLDQGNGGGVNNRPNMSFTAINSIMADNEDLTPNVFGPDCYSVPAGISSFGHNLVRIADGCNWPMVPFDLVGDFNNPFEPLLGPLADNGGETETHALLAGSPAIDAGHALACPSTDQRGVPRPVDGDLNGDADCDIGAFEYQIPTLITILSDSPDPSQPGEPFTITLSVSATQGMPTGAVTVAVSGGPQLCLAPLVGGVAACSLALSALGVYTLTATYEGDGTFIPSSTAAGHTVALAGSDQRLYLPVIRR